MTNPARSADPTDPVDPAALLAHAGWVRALARRLAADDAGGDDVAQQAILAALDRPPRTGAPLGPWLARVVRNLAWKARRAGARRARHEADAPTPRPPEPPDAIAARAETFRAVVDAVLALESIHRDVVVLRFFDGLATDEVAARLGVPVETARTRLKRALSVLRGRLGAERDGSDGRAAWAVILAPGASISTTTVATTTAVATTAPAPGVPHVVRGTRPVRAGRALSGTHTAAAVGGLLVAKKLCAVAVVLVLLVLCGVWVVQPTPTATDSAPDVADASADAVPAASRDAGPAPRDDDRRRGHRAARPLPSDLPALAAGDVPAPQPTPPAPLAPEESLLVRVVDAAGAPIAGVPVGLTYAGHLDWSPTDERGTWRVRRAPGEATVYTNAQKAVGGRFFDDAQRTVTPDDGEVVLALAETDPLVVTVVDDAGAPVAAIPVGLTHPGYLDWAPTDERGEWRARRVPWDATVYANVDKAVESDGGARWFLESDAPVTPTQRAVRLVLTEAVPVEGRVVDPDGTPLPLLEILVERDGRRVFKTNSEAGGVFAARVPARAAADVVLTGVAYERSGGGGGRKAGDASSSPSGQARLAVDVPVFAFQWATDSPWEGRLDGVTAATPAPLVLVAHRVPHDANLVVRVVDPAGGPVAGAHVSASRPGNWAFVFAVDRRPVTDAEGRIRLSGLDRRTVHVDASLAAAPEFAPDWLPPLPLDVVPRGQEVTLAFRAATPVAGQVLRDDGRPAAGARVRIVAPSLPPWTSQLAEAKTDDAGAFRVLLPIDAPRALRVEASLDLTRGGPVAIPPLTAVAADVAPGSVGVRVVLRHHGQSR